MNRPSVFMESMLEAATAQAAQSAYQVGLHHTDNGNYPEAFKNFGEAARRGHTDAMVELIICYENGLGTPKNPNAALPLYRQLADHGFPEAQRSILCWISNEHGARASEQKFADYAELLTGQRKTNRILRKIFDIYPAVEFRDCSDAEIRRHYAFLRRQLEKLAR